MTKTLKKQMIVKSDIVIATKDMDTKDNKKKVIISRSSSVIKSHSDTKKNREQRVSQIDNIIGYKVIERKGPLGTEY
jgi:fatty acid/phospholipid biosynthesis enzyme